MKPLFLGARRPPSGSEAGPSSPRLRLQSPAPSEVNQAGVGAGAAAAQRDMPDVPVEAIYAEGTPGRRTPRPPFRLLRPSVAAPPGNTPPPEPPPEPPGPTVQRNASAEAPKLRAELLARPLQDSLLGRRIVQLLTLSWVMAPSGLAATVLPLGAAGPQALGYAEAVDALACGAHAYADPAAGVLAIGRLDMLNRMLQRSGLSPLVPQAAPEPWPPLMVRAPCAFLLAGFFGDKTQLPYAQEPA